MAVAGLWRRRTPLRFLIVVGLLSIPLSHGLTSRDAATVTGLYIVLVPTYALGAFVGATARSARAGTLGLHRDRRSASSSTHRSAGSPAPCSRPPRPGASGAWRARQRELAARLRETSARLAAERDDRARLAVVGERTRIARDLHALVAHDVIAMVVQAEAAQSLLDTETDAARTAAAAIEQTGRDAPRQGSPHPRRPGARTTGAADWSRSPGSARSTPSSSRPASTDSRSS